MSRRMPFCALSGAMLALLPEARIAARKAQPWHSATFSGERVQIILELKGDDRLPQARAFAATLPDYGFDLRRQLVADICVNDERREADRIVLTVEALLIDE